ncbi:MAG: SRPBCC family protein [Myxococcota bacterium]
MTEISMTREIDAPAAAVWKVLSDFGQIAAWNPNLKKSYLVDGSAPSGTGAVRQCDMVDGKNWIRERIVDWKDGESYSVDIYEGTMPLKVAKATLGVRPAGADRAEAYMTIAYEPKFGPIGTMMDVLMMRSMMRKSVDNLLAGLEQRSAA